MYITVRLRELIIALLAVTALALCLFLPPYRGESRAVSAASAQHTAAPLLIIDPGHGGEDGGASSAEGVTESGINLSIALRLNALAGLFGIETLMTRTSEDIAYPPEAHTTAQRKLFDQRSRAALLDAHPDAVLISVHQNAYPDPRPSGSQVLYAETEGSRRLAEIAHEALRVQLCPDNRRVAVPAGEGIYLLRRCPCTAILVECGFLSNPQEAAKLGEDEYQKKISAVLLGSYLSYLTQPGEVKNETENQLLLH